MAMSLVSPFFGTRCRYCSIADFRFFKMAAVRHLGFFTHVGTTHEEYLVVFVTAKFGCNRRSNFDSMQMLIF